MTTRAQRIEAAIQAALNPSQLQLEDESHKHSVPAGAESHFKLVCVSDQFAGVMPVRRHQRVYAELQAELDAGLHALALHLYTPEEWAAQQQAPASPDCKGGSKADH